MSGEDDPIEENIIPQGDSNTKKVFWKVDNSFGSPNDGTISDINHSVSNPVY